VAKAASDVEIDSTFATFDKSSVGVLIVGADAFFTTRRHHIVSVSCALLYSGDLLTEPILKDRRSDFLWPEPSGGLSLEGRLRRENPGRRQARRSAGPTTDDPRADYQSQGCEGTRVECYRLRYSPAPMRLSNDVSIGSSGKLRDNRSDYGSQ
jgi:hypothetical protein